MSSLAVAEYTPEDLLTMPDGNRYELVDGQLMEKPMGAEADWIGGELGTLLRMFARKTSCGFVFGPESGYQCFRDKPRKVRKPDGSFIAKGRLLGDKIPKGHIRVVPDLALEVISPNEAYYEVEIKVQEYLDAGVRLVWVVNPALRSVRVFEHATGRTQDLHAGDELTGGEVLPGFRCAVADLFPPVDLEPAG